MNTSSERTRERKPPLSPKRQRITSSRILNEDGSLPRTTDEFILRGFQKLRDEKRLRDTAARSRDISDGSSKSRATYFCFSPERPTNISRDNGTTHVRISAQTPVEDTGSSRFQMSLESHEAKTRVLEAEISAIKRAAMLTRELRKEAAQELSTRSRVVRIHEDNPREIRESGMVEVGGNSRRNGKALMSGGRAEEYSIHQNMHLMNESMEGMPTPPQLLAREFKPHPAGIQRAHKKQDKRHSSRARLCLCPKCISVTQQVVNILAARYSMQSKEENSRIQNQHHPDQVEESSRKSKYYSNHISNQGSSSKTRSHSKIVQYQHLHEA